jgi:hypothetical protein
MPFLRPKTLLPMPTRPNTTPLDRSLGLPIVALVQWLSRKVQQASRLIPNFRLLPRDGRLPETSRIRNSVYQPSETEMRTPVLDLVL